MTIDNSVKEILRQVLDLQGLSIEKINSEMVIMGKDSSIDSLTLALFLVEVERNFNSEDLMNGLISLPKKSIDLNDVCKIIDRR